MPSTRESDFRLNCKINIYLLRTGQERSESYETLSHRKNSGQPPTEMMFKHGNAGLIMILVLISNNLSN